MDPRSRRTGGAEATAWCPPVLGLPSPEAPVTLGAHAREAILISRQADRISLWGEGGAWILVLSRCREVWPLE